MNARRYGLPRLGLGVWVLAVVLVAGQALAGPPKSRSRGHGRRVRAAHAKSSRSKPKIVSRSNRMSGGKKATAREYCNIHGLWKSAG